MKNTMTLVVLTAVIASGAAGVLGYSFASSQSNSSQPLATSALMNGHIQLVVTDENGQVKAYRQTDNAITTTGENCVAKMLFKAGSSTGTSVCTGANTNPFAYIAVGTGTTAESTTLTNLTIETSGSGLTRALGTVSMTNSTTNGGSAQVTVTKAFSVTGSVSVTEAGLFNDTAAGNTDSMFARKTFSAVSVANGDTLTVTWTINVGNTTTFN